MNADSLLRHFERVADAPGATERLRQLVRDLATRGKLLQQDSGDEHVSSVLRRLKIEQADDESFSLPSSWAWVCVGSVAQTRLGKMLDRAKNKGTPKRYLRNSNVRWFGFDLADLLEMNFEDAELPEFALRSGDVLICEGGEPGRAAVWDERLSDVYFQKAIHRVRFLPFVDSRYFVVALRASADDGRLADYFTGTGIKHLTGRGLDRFCFPLPPLAEQRRIVDKVDELIALCGRLGAARAKREAARDRLTAASLARLNTPDPESIREDARFALSAFASLTARQDQVPMLRQTILNLACAGKLVPQDPGEEPASVLLHRIAAGKSARKRATGDARIKEVPAPEATSLPMQLPTGWATQSFENLFLFIDYRGNTPTKTGDGVPLITAKNVRMGRLNREPQEFISAETYNTWMTRGFPQVDDLFFTTEAPLANVCLNDITEPFALAQRVICLQPYGEVNTKFLMFVLMSDLMQSLIDAHATGLTAKGIKAAKLKPLPIPIAPLEEQHRIVAKVDELLTLCDRLEASLASGGEHQRRLLEAVLLEGLSSDELMEEGV